ncbi:hypothetical protein JZ751_015506 [Albula glossodonta]|uniref:TGF-beta family profile domain-containing protein n=1 Tax=Albula glossodonta TaxID=121402 RepID=A0A8T2MVS9_9TELE|nr:hypothetical protein JZ751_015506 [Albula glossodonta]
MEVGHRADVVCCCSHRPPQQSYASPMGTAPHTLPKTFLIIISTFIIIIPKQRVLFLLFPLTLSSDSWASLSKGYRWIQCPPHRMCRAVSHCPLFLQDFSKCPQAVNYMLRSFTEGEMKQLIATLVDRTTARRTKRARNGLKLGVCRLREVQVSVTQLGLGYESEEVVSFKYCSGRCSSRRRNYDLTLKNVQSAGFVKDRPNRACCRPLQYEDKFSFLGDDNKPYTIRKLSALQCGCGAVCPCVTLSISAADAVSSLSCQNQHWDMQSLQRELNPRPAAHLHISLFRGQSQWSHVTEAAARSVRNTSLKPLHAELGQKHVTEAAARSKHVTEAAARSVRNTSLKPLHAELGQKHVTEAAARSVRNTSLKPLHARRCTLSQKHVTEAAARSVRNTSLKPLHARRHCTLGQKHVTERHCTLGQKHVTEATARSVRNTSLKPLHARNTSLKPLHARSETRHRSRCTLGQKHVTEAAARSVRNTSLKPLHAENTSLKLLHARSETRHRSHCTLGQKHVRNMYSSPGTHVRNSSSEGGSPGTMFLTGQNESQTLSWCQNMQSKLPPAPAPPPAPPAAQEQLWHRSVTTGEVKSEEEEDMGERGAEEGRRKRGRVMEMNELLVFIW